MVNHSEIHLKEKDLLIYRTGNLVNFDRYERFLYHWENGKYVLNDFPKGKIYKHFVLCDEDEKVKIKDMINSTGLYYVTGEGSKDQSSGKWRVWFINLSEPVEGEGVDMNNREVID